MIPAQLPTDVHGFTGRGGELATLDDLFGRSASGTGTAGTAGTVMVIAVIAGTAGVGKTALAVHWAHRAREHFPDGQLYLNLRGYDPARPVRVEEALATFLRDLGLAPDSIPSDPARRAATYRSLLANRRLLVVLDNANTADQVRPLLPGTPSCAVIITSRDTLTGLVARDGAHRIDLDLLPTREAIALLRTLIGPRVDAEPQAATALAARCAWLPLALRIAAELAATRADTTLQELVDELADHRHRLDLFDNCDDPHTAVRTVFSWSYRHLPQPAARAFRLLGTHPGRHWDTHTLAALTDHHPTPARTLLDRLTRANLIQTAGPARWSMHDLLRAYAAELTTQHDTETDRQAARTRLLDYYRTTASRVALVLHPSRTNLRPPAPRSDRATPPVDQVETAGAWLEAECDNLLAAVHASGPDQSAHAWAAAPARTWRSREPRPRRSPVDHLHQPTVGPRRSSRPGPPARRPSAGWCRRRATSRRRPWPTGARRCAQRWRCRRPR